MSFGHIASTRSLSIENEEAVFEKNPAVEALFNGTAAETSYQEGKARVWTANCQGEHWYSNILHKMQYALGFLTFNHVGLLAPVKKEYNDLKERVTDLTKALKDAVKIGSEVSIEQTESRDNAAIALGALFQKAIDKLNNAIYQLSQSPYAQQTEINVSAIVDTTIACFIEDDKAANPLLNDPRIGRPHFQLAFLVLEGASHQQFAQFLETLPAEMSVDLRDRAANTLHSLLRRSQTANIETLRSNLSHAWIQRHQQAANALLEELRATSTHSEEALHQHQARAEQLRGEVERLSDQVIPNQIARQRQLEQTVEEQELRYANDLTAALVQVARGMGDEAEAQFQPFREDAHMDREALEQALRTREEAFDQTLAVRKEEAKQQVLTRHPEYATATQDLATLAAELEASRDLLTQKRQELGALEEAQRTLLQAAQRDAEELATKGALFDAMREASREAFRGDSPEIEFKRSYVSLGDLSRSVPLSRLQASNRGTFTPAALHQPARFLAASPEEEVFFEPAGQWGGEGAAASRNGAGSPFASGSSSEETVVPADLDTVVALRKQSFQQI